MHSQTLKTATIGVILFGGTLGAASVANAGFLPAVIDDFSGSAGLGFSRSNLDGASLSGGSGLLTGNSGFQYLQDSQSYDASAYSGFSLKVDGSLGTGGLFLSVIGANLNFVATDVDFGSTTSNGYAWITFAELDAAVGNDPGTIAGALSSGFGFIGIGIYTTRNAAISVDDFEFRSSAIPAPGAIALLGVVGAVGARRRRR